MNTDSLPPEPIDLRRIQQVLAIVHDQIATALWLSAGMLFAIAALACLALNLRRTALALGFTYSLTLCFVRNGHAQILGPLGCGIALAGFFWPVRSSR